MFPVANVGSTCRLSFLEHLLASVRMWANLAVQFSRTGGRTAAALEADRSRLETKDLGPLA